MTPASSMPPLLPLRRRWSCWSEKKEGEKMKEGQKELWEKQLSSEYLYRGKIVNLRRDQVLTPGGREPALREIVEHPGAVAILALDREERLVLVRQYRHAAGEVLLEVPAGKLEPGEEPLRCAQRELAEETGCRGGAWSRLTQFYSSPGFCDEQIHLFMAKGVVPGEPLAADDDEVLEPLWLDLEEAQHLLAEGRINDGKTIIALQLASIMKV